MRVCVHVGFAIIFSLQRRTTSTLFAESRNILYIFVPLILVPYLLYITLWNLLLKMSMKTFKITEIFRVLTVDFSFASISVNYYYKLIFHYLYQWNFYRTFW